MKIRAAVLRDADGPYEIEDVDLAEPGSSEVLIRIVGAGFCHTDLVPRVPDFPVTPPIVTGHEGSGVVEAVGSAVDDLTVGDHVVLSYDSCQSCQNCLKSLAPYCDTFFARNLTGYRLDGSTPIRDSNGQPVAARWFGQSSFATYAIVSARNAVVVDSALPLELMGPLGCGVQTGAGAVLVAFGVEEGSSIVVFGAGAVGLAAVMAAKVAGASTIVAVDINPARLELARHFGATSALDGSRQDLLAELSTITGGAQYCLDTTGVPSVISAAIQALRPTGKCGLVGLQRGDITIDPTMLSVGRTVTGILEGDAIPQTFIPRLIALWQQGRFPFDQLIKTFPLDQINEAERATLAGEVVKPVLLP